MPDALVAAIPILVVLALMLFARWPATRAGLIGLATALVIALVAFPFEPVDASAGTAIAGALAEALFTTAAILWIIVPALAIYNLQQATAAVDTIRSSLAGLAGDPRLTAIVVAWFFALLLEGAAGFGTSAALAAPFLVALGMTPVRAVVAAMVGHLIGVTFGAVGTPVVPMVAASDLEPVELSAAIALQAVLVGWAAAVIVVLFIRRAYPDAPAQRTTVAVAIGLAAALAFFVPYALVAWFVGPELPTLAGAIVGGAAFVAVIRWRSTRAETSLGHDAEDNDGTVDRAGPEGADEADGPGTLPALAPYLVLVAVVLVTRLIPPVRDPLRDAELRWELVDGTFSGSFAPLFHPGTMLVIAFLAGAVVQGARRTQVRGAVAASVRTIVPVAGALLAMLALARVMVHAGMVDEIAGAAADSVGGAWPLLAPAVGALGTFVTGSATASNVLFSDLQVVTAGSVGAPVGAILGAQGVGAALGNAIAPHNVVAAAAVVGLAGRESSILRATLPVSLALVAAAGLGAALIAGV